MSDSDEKTRHLHQLLIDSLKQKGCIRSPLVEAAFRSVPRHIFVPNASYEEAYKDVPIGTNRKDGKVVSSSSAPGLMAEMLERLNLKEGQNVLEIGAGTGYNAALMAHIVGPKGKVVTIDIDQDIVDDATSHIQEVGFNNVKVICRDGALGDEEKAPYDRIILTVGVPDIARAWISQLKDGGLLEIPLELTQLESVLENPPLIVFEKHGGHLESKYIQRCGFMRLRGSHLTKTQGMHEIPQIPDLFLITPMDVDLAAISGALLKKASEVSLGLTVKYGDLFGLHLWFTLRLSNHCNLYATGESMRLARFFTRDDKSYSTVGLCSSDSLCVLHVQNELRGNNDLTRLVIKTYGGNLELTNKVKKQLQEWDEKGRPFAFKNNWEMQGVKIEAFPGNTKPKIHPNSVEVEKRSATLVIGWS